MTTERQKTIQRTVSLTGVGLHTGEEVTVCLSPAGVNQGIRLRRTDLAGSPEVELSAENISSDNLLPRCTTIGKGEAVVHTIEHFMAALYGLGIDNMLVELNGREMPGFDGSGLEFIRAIKAAGVAEQDAAREYIEIKEPLFVNNHGSSILLVPDGEFKISYTLSYEHPLLQAQFVNLTVTSEVFEQQIAPSRTFCLEEEARQLQERGLGKGANYRNTLVLGKKGIIQNQARFPDEFARHKVLDFIGDMYILGRPLRGHVFAIKSGHGLNIELIKKIKRQEEKYRKKGVVPGYDFGDKKELDVRQIMAVLPHRYPFLLVDRILELEKGKKAVGLKNVTINDNFFAGHFPSRPIMPGVLMVEALAQVGGILVLTSGNHPGKVALFMAADNVKFRRPVVPGDQLLLVVEIMRDRPRTVSLRGIGRVGEEVVAEADMIFSFIETDFLDR